MAYWGIAMTWWHPIWAPPSASDLAAGTAAATRAAELSANLPARERGYIDAVAVFYGDSKRVDHRTRAKAYSDAMLQLSKALPDDHEVQIFYALSLLGSAPPDDATFANQKKAAAILNALLPLEPQHPGIAHYMIHSFDYPQLAADALPAAHAYSRIAPGFAARIAYAVAHLHAFGSLAGFDRVEPRIGGRGPAPRCATTSRCNIDGYVACARLPRIRLPAER